MNASQPSSHDTAQADFFKKHVTALTGGVGSGKSTVRKIFASWGAITLDVDTVAKHLRESDPEILEFFIKHFGKVPQTQEILNQMSSHPTFQGDFEKLLHPKIREFSYHYFLKFFHPSQFSPSSQYHPQVFIYEASLIFEKQLQHQFKNTVLVAAPKNIRKQRLLTRNAHWTEGQANHILKSQWSDEQKIPHCDQLILNTDSLENLITRCTSIWSRLTDC